MSYISVADFAVKTGLSKQRVYQLIESGRLPVKTFGKVKLIEVAEAEKWRAADSKDGRVKIQRIIASLLFFSLLCGLAFGKVDMSVIAEIESNGGKNPRAYDLKRHDVGLYQITPPCLADYNFYNKTNYKKIDLLYDEVNAKIADWYLNKRIPQLLKHYGLAQTDENVLYAWNSGIGNLRKGNVNKAYVKTYNKLKG